MLGKIRAGWAYLKDRLDERSTWGDIIVGISAAAILPWPWSAASLIAAVVKALIPDGRVAK
jgi:hypothetical protein